MTASAIVMMLVATGTIWGGLVVSVIHLSRSKDQGEGEFDEA